jgi:lipopolysaccharide export system protein LptA
MRAMDRFRRYLSVGALVLIGLGAVALPAMGQIGLGARQNNNEPIDISSDTLEVQQDKQLAIFRGKVDVIQGDTRLRSDELFVYYKDRNPQQSGQGQPQRQQPPRPAAAAGATAGAGPDSSAISKIEAKGNVFVSTPKERAQGDFGVYDVDKRTVTLTGNVLLTSDESTLRCARAVMYQDTGRSTCDPAAGQRVRGVIIPNNSGGNNNAAPAPGAPAQQQGGQRR